MAPLPVQPRIVASLWRYAVVAIAVIAIAGALNVGAVVALPIVGGLLLAAMLWPLREWSYRWLPAWTASAICCIVIVVAGLLMVGWGAYAGMRATELFQESRQEYIDQYERLRDGLDAFGVPRDTLPELHVGDSADGSGGPLLGWETRRRLTELVTGGLRSAAAVTTTLLMTVGLAFFALLEAPRWAIWARVNLRPSQAEDLIAFVRTMSGLSRSYFLGKAVSGAISGLATWLWLSVMGVPMPLIWGIFTLIMNFIPNVGAIISGLPPTLLAVVESGWASAVVVGAGLLVIETAVGNLLDPILQGTMLDLSTFVVLASLVFWGWLWGIAGAVLSPVLSAAVVAAVSRYQDHRARPARLQARGVSTPE